jgi:hypothetical protein
LDKHVVASCGNGTTADGVGIARIPADLNGMGCLKS